MKRIIVISIAVVLALLPALAMSCSGGGDSKDLEGKIKWTETAPFFSCSYDPPPTGYVNVNGDYKVTLYGQVQNVSKDKLELVSVIRRLYNSADEMVGEVVTNPNPLGCYEIHPAQHTWMGFTENYPQEVVSYDVFVTDIDGNEYLCLRD